MSKGSGRRRITPSDGLRYNPDTDMTNIEERGATSTMSASRELTIGLRTGAAPTAEKDYGSHDGSGTNGRYGGKGRKNDHRSWKGYTKGKQFEHNLTARERAGTHKPASLQVTERLREKSMNADIVVEAKHSRFRQRYKKFDRFFGTDRN